MEIAIIGWLLLSAGVGYIASERGRSGVSWALLAILTSPLCGIIIVLLMRDLKVDGLNYEREEMRHREQLAALAGRKTVNITSAPVGEYDWFRPPTSAEDSLKPQPIAPIADELGKLASLLERGHLTKEEFAEQKSRLFGRKTSPNQKLPMVQASIPNSKLEEDLSSPDKCRAFLIARGCRVTQPTELVWEIMKPSGVTTFAHSTEALHAFAMRFSAESSLFEAG